MANYIIGIGGTGSRCLEAVIYLAAAGVFTQDINVLLIDPDVNNGNSAATTSLVNNYYSLKAQRQPQNPQKKGLLTPKVTPPVFFKASINNEGANPARWNTPHRNAGRSFKHIVQYDSRPEKLKQFINLFYDEGDLEMDLEVGYQGRTSVGSVALKQDLEETAESDGIGLRELLASLTRDLQRETKIFVVGSIFGGTGAAGIPTIPALIENLNPNVLPQQNRNNLRWGTALLAPYFSFPQPTSSNGEESSNGTGPGINSVMHPIASKAALIHYAHTPPGYQHLYLLGAPYRHQTNTENSSGGSRQRNLPHYIEIMAALAAFDFFNMDDEISPADKYLHFADTYDKGRDLGVNWETLPVSLNNPLGRRTEIKQKLVVFTTFAYVYHKILHQEFILNKDFTNSPMYKENFANLNLESNSERQVLRSLNNFCESYLNWLREIGTTAGNSIDGVNIARLFNWADFEVDDIAICAQRVGSLMQQGTLVQTAHASPRYANEGYSRIMSNLNKIKLQSPDTQSAAGLFIYLLSQAVNRFCHDNYRW